MQYNGSASNPERLIGGLHIAAVSSAWRSLSHSLSLSPSLQHLSPTAHARAPPPPHWIRTLRHGCPAVPRPGGLLLLGAVKEEKGKGERNHAGTANGFRESASDHAVILRIQGRRHPALPSDRRRIPGESNPRTGWIKKTTVHFFKNNMKITSHHLMITSLDFRSNLRLIPLLLLFLGYSRGMPHVLRFGKNLCVCVCLFVCSFRHDFICNDVRPHQPVVWPRAVERHSRHAERQI